jgi:hypothetical protein
MHRSRWLSAVAVAAGLFAGPLAEAPAYGDGDPASDVLLYQRVFFPFRAPSAQRKAQLAATVAAAKRSGYPIRVAVIQAPSDLGAVPQLFGKPQTYAHFLDAELGYVGLHGLLVIVMPQGFGVAAGGRITKSQQYKPRRVERFERTLMSARPPRSASPDDLVAAGIDAVRVLAAAAGHPLPRHLRIPEASSASGTHSASRTDTGYGSLPRAAALLALAALGASALVLLGIGVYRYRTRPPVR